MDAALATRYRGPPLVGGLIGVLALVVAMTVAPSLERSGTGVAAELDAGYAQLPLSFEPNAGRTDPRIDFLAHSIAGGSLYLSGREAMLAFDDEAVRLRFTGGAGDPGARGLKRLPGEANSFIGDDPSQWRAHIPTYGGVRYDEVYPGIDVDFYGSQRNLEYDFRLAPHADPSQIAIGIRGAESIRLDPNGDLLIGAGKRTVTQHAPVAYQSIAGTRRPVESAYVLKGSTATLELGPYDRSRPLVIDPTLTYSTYLGGNANDFIYAIAVDSSGAAYVSGHTLSTDFPTVGPYQGDQTGGDAFVSKLNPAGTALVYSTYLGGDSAFDDAFGIAVDSAGAAYVGGRTNSTDFPTEDEYQVDQTSFDAFVTKLAPSGAALEYSTYLGGGSLDDGFAIAVDPAGAAYLTGATSSTDFPTQEQFQTDQPSSDAFITRVNPDPGGAVPVTLGYSSYLGGDSADQGSGVAVDSTGAAYLTGHTSSTNFLTQNPFQGTDPPQQDAFVTKVNADPGGAVAPTLGYSTYLGGAGNFEQGLAIAVDSAGSAYVTGRTESTDFPTQGQFQSDQPGHDAFATKLNPAGNTLAYSTYLGGSANDWGFGIAVDSANSAYVAGITGSADFPQLGQFQADALGDDIFVTKLTPAGSTLAYSTLLGGNGTDFGRAIALDSSGNAYVAGYTSSTDFPLVATTSDRARLPDDPVDSGVVAKVNPEGSGTVYPPLTAEKFALTSIFGHRDPNPVRDIDDVIIFVVRISGGAPGLYTPDATETPESEANFDFPTGPGPYTQDQFIGAEPKRTGLLTNTVRVRGQDGSEATASATVRIYDADTTIIDALVEHLNGQAKVQAAAQQLAGSAIDKVEVAVLKATAGLKPFGKAKRCEWLTKKGEFKQVKPADGTCDAPVWIKAKLGKTKKGKTPFGYEFKHDLDPGKYIAYSRATNKAGASESTFSKKLGNLKKFKVKR